jgi:hypothetical protein
MTEGLVPYSLAKKYVVESGLLRSHVNTLRSALKRVEGHLESAALREEVAFALKVTERSDEPCGGEEPERQAD